jgi:tetratricopeptide (TPR) repeat protein
MMGSTPRSADARARLDGLLHCGPADELAQRLTIVADTSPFADQPGAAATLLAEWIRGHETRVPSALWIFASEVFLRAGRRDEARWALGRSLDARDPRALDLASRALASLARLDAMEGRWDQAAEAWEEALRLQPANAGEELSIRKGLAEACEVLGEPDMAVAHLGEGLRLAATSGRVSEELDLLSRLGHHMLVTGRLDPAGGYFQQVVVRSHEEGHRGGEAAGEIGLGAVCLELAEFDDAAHHLRRGVAAARDAGDQLLQVHGLERLAELERRRGATEAERVALEEAIFLAKGSGSNAALAGLYHMLALHHEAGDHPGLALGAYERASDERRAAGDAAGLGATLNNLASLHVRLGDLDAARAHYREALLAFNDCTGERPEREIVLENLHRLDARVARDG